MVNHWLMKYLVGGWATNPSEKWWTESQLGWWHFQYDGKVIKIPWFQTTSQLWIRKRIPTFIRLHKESIFDAKLQANPIDSTKSSLREGILRSQEFKQIRKKFMFYYIICLINDTATSTTERKPWKTPSYFSRIYQKLLFVGVLWVAMTFKVDWFE